MPQNTSGQSTVDTGYQARITRAGAIVGRVKRNGVNQWKVISTSRAAKNQAVDGWIVTALLPGARFECNCPDNAGQEILRNNQSIISRTWGGREEGFYPCKHIIAVCMKEGYSFMDIVINELRSPKRYDVAFTQKTTTAEETLIAIGSSNQVQVYSLKVELEGSSANTVTLRDGIGGSIVDKFVLVNQGDTKGFISNHVEYALTNDLRVELSTTETVNIYTRSINI